MRVKFTPVNSDNPKLIYIESLKNESKALEFSDSCTWCEVCQNLPIKASHTYFCKFRSYLTAKVNEHLK